MTWVISWEGSKYENVPGDDGGATKYGIDQASHPHVDIKNLTEDQAEQIYWDESWVKLHAEELPLGVSEVMSNIAINTGIGHATKWLQEALGTTADGIIGPNTIKLANDTNAKALTEKLIRRLETFYRAIGVGHNAQFLKGWLNRTASLRVFVSKL